MGYTYTKKLFIGNSNLTEHAAPLFAKSGNLTLIPRIFESDELAGNDI